MYQESTSQLEQLFSVKNKVAIVTGGSRGIDGMMAEGLRLIDNQEADETATGGGEMFCRENHPCGKPVVVQAPDWVRIGENHSYKRLSPTPEYGCHNEEILREFGYNDAEIARFNDVQAIR